MDHMCSPSYMPPPHSSSALHFGGNPYEVLTFLQTVDQLGQYHGLSKKVIIKYALWYTNPDDKELFKGLPESKGDIFEDFANEILLMYPQHGIFLQYIRPSDLTPQHLEPEEPKICQPALHEETPEHVPAPSTLVLVANELAPAPHIIISDTLMISDKPAVADPTITDPQSVDDTITMVIDIDVLTHKTLSVDLKPLADAIPEIPASDFADIWDIDIRVFDYEPETSLCHQDTPDKFLFA
ncbi:hypothetical protein BDR05DRAFT_953319 [Suillus weaverae]|nr:hypothetical protein BDR05DRAFT_953319 [Suillus weaverae]